MSKIGCFNDLPIPGLKNKFDNQVTEDMPLAQQREIGTQIALDFHKQLHDELNALKRSLGEKTTPYVRPDTSAKVKAIEDKYAQDSEKETPKKERKFAKQIKEDEETSPKVTKGMSQESKEYTPKSYEESLEKTSGKTMDDFMDRSNSLTPDERVVLGEKLIRQFNASEEFDKAIAVAENLTMFLTDIGRGVSAAKVFSMLSPEGVIRYVVKEIGKKKTNFNKKTKGHRGRTKAEMDAVNKGVLNDPRVRNEITNRIKKGSVKKAIDFLENLKVDTKGKALDAMYGITAAAWNGLITAVQKGLQAGLTITQAINRAAKNITNENFDERGAKEYLNESLKDYRVTLDPQNAIREELKNQEETIDSIVRDHYTKIDEKKRSLVDKLVKDANLTEEQAESISKYLEEEFDRLTRKSKQKILDKYLPKGESKNRKANRQSLIDELITASNLGAITDEQYRDAISEKIGVDQLTEAQAQKISELSQKVQDAKPGFDQNRATEKLYNYLEAQKQLSWMEVGMAIWYANILSGLSTQMLNISANAAETIGEVYTSSVTNPKQAGWIFKGLFTGWGRGLLEAWDTIKHGYQPTKNQNKIGTAGLLERIELKGGVWNPYNYLKYVARFMNAADIFFYQGLNEMKARELAVVNAKKQGKDKPNRQIIKEATEMLYGKGVDPFAEAQEQAANEGFEGIDLERRAYEILEQNRPEFIINDSNDEAARGTFNYDPEGTLGKITQLVGNATEQISIKGFKPGKFIVPFTRIIANVTNRYLDWTPIGLLRAAKGGIGWSSMENTHREYTSEERTKVFIRAITGMTAMAALYALSDDEDGLFEITANGTGDTTKNFELQESGWRPYSIKIGDTWYEYKNTPLAIPFATIGFIRDAEKYNNDKELEKKVSIIMFGTIRYVMDMSFLQSLSSFFDTFSQNNRGGASTFFSKAKQSVGNTAKSVIIPNAFTQASRSMQEIMDMPIKRANGTFDQMIRDMPILRDHLGNIYDALGDPVVPNQIERFIPLKPSPIEDTDASKLWGIIIENNAWIGRPSRGTQKLNGDSMTDEEFDRFALLSGQLTKKKLLQKYSRLLREDDQEKVKDMISDIKRDARKEARRKIR
jgi:hypothetical protein